ncbi:MAG: hypothetical protein Q4G67_01030 [Actinomycetia bacterium]|nr:hypothetical protein [Actinomycetes bacterium]
MSTDRPHEPHLEPDRPGAEPLGPGDDRGRGSWLGVGLASGVAIAIAVGVVLWLTMSNRDDPDPVPTETTTTETTEATETEDGTPTPTETEDGTGAVTDTQTGGAEETEAATDTSTEGTETATGTSTEGATDTATDGAGAGQFEPADPQDYQQEGDSFFFTAAGGQLFCGYYPDPELAGCQSTVLVPNLSQCDDPEVLAPYISMTGSSAAVADCTTQGVFITQEDTELENGQSLAMGPLSCEVLDDEVRCRHADSGHGFRASLDEFAPLP